MLSALDRVGLGCANFLVICRTHSTLMKELGVDPKLVADQLGHTLGNGLRGIAAETGWSLSSIMRALKRAS